jgi:CheY-like chemotaxis protein/HPt (histidine-containing phosphotransfer) domain-containing protein/anti-sigma regulatory factor (Ser/Thr protein kinase)
MDLESVDFNVLDVIEEVLVMFAPLAAKKGLELASRSPPKCNSHADLRGDQFRLRQVISNLVSNAIKFTERGEVVVQAAFEEAADDRIAMELRVVDTGIGIESEVIDKIFESFSQADGSTTRRYGGTGLGLAICRQLVSLMGGSIHAESRPGSGSKFVVRLSLPRARQPLRPLLELAELRGLRALVIDDNRTNREILCEQLEGQGMQVACAACGEEALELMTGTSAAAPPFDLIVLDLLMPDMDGMAVAAKMRALPEASRSPILMLTSTVSSAPAEEREKLGIQRVLSKPVRHVDLMNTIRAMLTERAAPETSARVSGVLLDQPPELCGAVLLVDDTPMNQMVSEAMLKSLGLVATLATNGKIALELVREQQFDLVLMDCQMPVMDGYEATAAIRELPGTAGRVPIVALTANAMQGDRLKCERAGMDGYLSKPFTLAQLAATLGRWLPGVAQECPPARDTGVATVDPINARQLETLREIGSRVGTDLVGDVLRVFLEAPGRYIEPVIQAIDAGDAPQLSRVVHALKSSAANLGAEGLSAIYRAMEQAGRNERLDEAGALLSQLQREHASVVSRAREILTEVA